MKQAFVLFLFALSCTALPLQAQSNKSNAPTRTQVPSISAEREAIARATTDALAAKYQLDADQAKQMYTVQVRKQRNLNQIETIRESKPDIWRAKMKAIQQGTLASIRRLLHSKEQVELYQNTQKEVRMQQASKRKELMVNNATNDAIEAAMLDIYAE